MFKIEDYNNKKIAIHVKTQEEYDKLMEILFKLGTKNIRKNMLNYWVEFKKDTCINLEHDNFSYYYQKYYEDEVYQIVEFADIIQFTKSDLQDTDIVTNRNGKNYLAKDFISDGLLNEDLTYTNYNKLDIIKVERPTNLVTVYEREEKVKVSLDELVKCYEEVKGVKVAVK